eukprot:g10094.t1
MGRGKKGKNKASSGAGDLKSLRSAVEAAVNEAVKIQDSASDLPPADAAIALETATQRYREALTRLPTHAEASYNLATCLSEQADLKANTREKVALLRESRATLESVIAADTSGRGATTALAHHALGNVICGLVEEFREHCPTTTADTSAIPCVDCRVPCPSAAECKQELSQACRHLETAISITERLQNQSGDIEEILVHLGDAFSSMMQMVMDGASAEGGMGASGHGPSPGLVQEALALCSNACSKYSEALSTATSSGGSDTDILRLKAGTVVNFLDWALPEVPLPQQSPSGVGFPPEELLATGEQTVVMLLGLDGDNVGGLLAKGDLCRLRARVWMLSSPGAGVMLREEGSHREESLAWFARAVQGSPQDSEALTAAGEGLLEYGRRSMTVYKQAAISAQGAYGASALSAPHLEEMRMSAVSRLQEAGSLLSRASSIDTSDTESPYNAACAFALSGDTPTCFQALTEFCRRLTVTIAAPEVSSSRRDAARWSLREASADVDLEGVRGADWFVGLLNSTEAAMAGGVG